MAFYQFNNEQFIPADISRVWDFISSPANLRRITPGSMGFSITSEQLPENIYAGMIIRYSVKPIPGVKTTWITEITHINEGRYFVDEQRIGPFAMWHHEHILEPENTGVKMKDIVSYQPPLGVIGGIANRLFISKQLKFIFTYREKALQAFFEKKQHQ